MCIRYQILYSSKKLANGVETITHIGGKNPLGEVWNIKVEQALIGLKSGNWEFFINANRKTYSVQIAETEFGIEVYSVGTDRNLILELSDYPH